MCFGSSRGSSKGKKHNSPPSFSSLRARAGQKHAILFQPFFFFAPAGSGGKKHSRLFSFFQCARAGQKSAYWSQPGVGGEKHNRLFLFSPLRAYRTENVLWFQPGVGETSTAAHLRSFSSLRARRAESCALVPARPPFFFVPAGRGGKETQQLVLIFFTARVQDRKMRSGSNRKPGVGERSTTACSCFLHCARVRQKNVLWSHRRMAVLEVKRPLQGRFGSETGKKLAAIYLTDIPQRTQVPVRV
jgi:hypothetical protein